MKENTFIRVYNNAIDLDYCDTLIEKFESHSEQHERMNTKDAKKLEDGVYVRGSMLFDELHLWKYMDTWKEDVDKLASIFTKNVDDYKSEFSAHCFPKKYGFEPFKMNQDVITDCTKGSMVIFPPMWPWLHRGTKPIKSPKYFMGGYLHYIE